MSEIGPDPSRVVEIKGAREGSGYLIGPRLILTSWHVLCSQDGTVTSLAPQVRILRDYRAPAEEKWQTRSTRVLWPNNNTNEHNDFALLILTDEKIDAGDGTISWCRLPSWGLTEVYVAGFPDFAIFKSQETQTSAPFLERDTAIMPGWVLGGSGLKQLEVYDRGTFDIRIRPELAPSESALSWEGMSGAAVFIGQNLVGVVRTAGGQPVHHLLALPVDRLFRKDEVRAAIHSAGLPSPAEHSSLQLAISEHRYDFGDLVHTYIQGFVGREWVIAEFDNFRRNKASGYFCIVADAGFGKTAIAASMATLHNSIPFFFSESEGRIELRQCLQHLSAALILRFSLKHEQLPERASRDWDFISSLFKEIIDKGNSSVIVIVDAADEAENVLGGNTLLLPRSLPAGIYVVLTSRIAPKLYVDAGVGTHFLTIDEETQYHQQDIKRFIKERIDDPNLRQKIQDASQWNFMYLAYLLSDLAQTPRPDWLGPESLPHGLPGYYERFWEGMASVLDKEGWQDWNDLYRPTIEFLAAALEPVNAAWLAELVGRPESEITERALNTKWRRFLVRRGTPSSVTWRIIHKSFAEFLSTGNRVNVPRAHEHIAQQALARWGGLKAGIPALPAGETIPHRDSYGFRHVVSHLRRAGLIQLLSNLIHQPRWQSARMAADPSGDIHRSDWLELWSAISEQNASKVSAAETPNVGQELECALSIGSLNSVSKNLSAGLLVGLVKSRHWSPETALAAARLNPDVAEACRSLGALAPFFEIKGVQEALQFMRPRAAANQTTFGALLRRLCTLGYPSQALSEAMASSTPAAALEELAGDLPEALLEQAIQFARALINPKSNWTPDRNVDALAALLRRAPEHLLGVGRDVAATLESNPHRGTLNEAMSLRAAELGKWKLARTYIDAIASPYVRALALSGALTHAPPAEIGCLVDAILRLSGVEHRSTKIVISVLPWVDDKRREELLRSLLPKPDDWFDDRAVRALSRLLPVSLIAEAFATSEKLKDEDDRADFRSALALRLADFGQIDDAIAMARRAGDGYNTSRAMIQLLPRLAKSGHAERATTLAITFGQHFREQFLSEAMAVVAREVGEPWLSRLRDRAQRISGDDRRQVLLAIAEGYASISQPATALALARLIGDEDAQIEFQIMVALSWNYALRMPEKSLAAISALPSGRLAALKGLARDLPRPGNHRKVIKEAINAAAEIAEPNWERQQVLSELFLHLCQLGDIDEAWDLAERKGGGDTNSLLAKIADYLPEPTRTERLIALLHTLIDVDEYPLSLISHLTLGQLREFWKNIERLPEWKRYHAIPAIAQQMARIGDAEGALALTFSLPAYKQADPLSAIAPFLDLDHTRRALAADVELSFLGSPTAALLARLAALGHAQEALTTAASHNDEQRMLMLEQIIPHLPLELLPQALSMGRTTPDAEKEQGGWRLREASDNAIAAIALRYAILSKPAESMRLAREMISEYRRDQAIIQLAPHLPPKLLEDAKDLVAYPHKADWRYEPLAALLPLIAEQGESATRRALLLASDIPEPRNRQIVLRNLLPRLTPLPNNTIYELWNHVARMSSHRTRAEVLNDLGILIPLMGCLSGAQGLEDASRYLTETVARWP
jgi:hypothetical protein